MAVILVTGGIRSGKSRHAEGLAGGLSDVTYVETGAPDGGGGQEWSRRLTPCFREVKLLSSRDTRPTLTRPHGQFRENSRKQYGRERTTTCLAMLWLRRCKAEASPADEQSRQLLRFHLLTCSDPLWSPPFRDARFNPK